MGDYNSNLLKNSSFANSQSINFSESIIKNSTRITRGLGAVNGVYNISDWQSGRISNGQFGFELTSTGIGSFAPAPISIPWTIGYEGVGRLVYGNNPFGIRDRVRPWVRRNILGIKD